MTDRPKRKPAGAAVAGAVVRPINYPNTISVMVSDETVAAIAREATRRGVKKAVVSREWLDAGRLSQADSSQS